MALLVAAVVGQQGVRHLVACLQDGVLPGVQGLLLLRLGHLQSGNDLSVLEDGLRQRADGREYPLAGVDDGANRVGECGIARDGDVGVEARASRLYVVEALCQLHLGSVHVGTVGQQLCAYAGSELRGQRLLAELAARNLVSGFVEQQRHRVLHLADLLAQVYGLGLHLIVAGLGTLHARRAGASQFLLQLHHVPGLLDESLHVGDDGQLLVEHHERVVEVGHAADDVGLHGHLIVFRGQQLHLCRALLREDVAEEVDVPAGCDGQLVGLRRRCTIHLHAADGALRGEGYAGQEGQLGHLEHVLHHLHVERCVGQVGIVVECRLDEALQLRVGEHLAPGQVAEVLVGIHGQRVGI